MPVRKTQSQPETPGVQQSLQAGSAISIIYPEFVDQYPNFVDANGNIIAARLPDTIHPDQIGYDLMGATWAAALQQAAPVPEASTVLLLGIGTLGLIGWAWRRRKQVA